MARSREDGDLSQDLLRTATDEDTFEALATTVPLRVDPATGASEQLGPPGLYQYVEDSPDGQYLLVYRLQRPLSFRVPNGLFARRTEVWTAAGEPVRVIADLPVSDQVPMMGVPTGPRLATWDERSPAKLIWVEALDGGDPVAAGRASGRGQEPRGAVRGRARGGLPACSSLPRLEQHGRGRLGHADRA